ncbi:aspartate kinase [Faecalibaculum rodentium]|jgi:aspartate kinase|uniref:aspartate kinase n=1 Tax=Faecalibaculum rodentium TaxID=1702221 RepID=UPI002492889C|nr:aspartate kinase [Faecalibaculum rodentium]
MLKVTKFGGSSVADACQFRKVRDIIQSDPDRRYVVVSAPGRRTPADAKLTDLLYLLDAHRQYHVDASNVYRIIRERILGIQKELGLKQNMAGELDTFYANLNQMKQDEIVSRGEYWCAKMMAEFLGFPFVDARDVICFNLDKTIDFKATKAKLQAKMAEHEHFVFPGFYGSTANGRIQVFTRGGGDITGAILANAMDADVYENWTDVSGFLMADPTIVDKPHEITHITYSELRELSYMGASVLHEEAIFPVKECNIPIHILNTNRPQDPGTFIQENRKTKSHYPITGIAGKSGFVSLYVYKKHMSSEVGYMRKVLSILEDYNVSIEHIPSGIDSFTVVMEEKDVENTLYEIVSRIKRELKPDEVKVQDNISLISTVGKRMSDSPGMAGRLFTALGRENISIMMIAQDSNEINITVAVETPDFETAVKAIYDEFVTKEDLQG